MANRHLLAMSDVQEFKTWLMQKGWIIQPIRSEYEIVRAVKSDTPTPLLIYRKNNETIFATVPDAWKEEVFNFYANKDNVDKSETNNLRDALSEMKQALCLCCKATSTGNCDTCKWQDSWWET